VWRREVEPGEVASCAGSENVVLAGVPKGPEGEAVSGQMLEVSEKRKTRNAGHHLPPWTANEWQLMGIGWRLLFNQLAADSKHLDFLSLPINKRKNNCTRFAATINVGIRRRPLTKRADVRYVCN
jgi:hypothetical protein